MNAYVTVSPIVDPNHSRINSMIGVERNVNRPGYNNSARRERSEGTRQRIIDAARAIMVERGYRGTTIAEIAGRADVHVDTVYELVGRKPVLLKELIEQAISGTDRAVIAEERDYVKALQAEPHARNKLAMYARAVRAIQSRIAPLLVALRDAAETEPEARQVWLETSNRRAKNMRKFARDLHRTTELRADVSIEQAADVV
ncbi:MAG: TetR/AcrR family transcriptional regulator, partial [Ilumatobacteraceae bacterium]